MLFKKVWFGLTDSGFPAKTFTPAPTLASFAVRFVGVRAEVVSTVPDAETASEDGQGVVWSAPENRIALDCHGTEALRVTVIVPVPDGAGIAHIDKKAGVARMVLISTGVPELNPALQATDETVAVEELKPMMTMMTGFVPETAKLVYVNEDPVAGALSTSET